MKSPDFSRRRFLQGAALLSAPLILPGRVWSQATAPSKRLNVGCIGMGKQMHGHVGNLLPRDDVQIVAVCDVDTTRREHQRRRIEEAYAKKTGESYKGCAAYTDFRELLARKDIDIVLIATPDHWHTLVNLGAARAKKDVYGEKPLTLTIDEGRRLVGAVRQSGIVLQTGTQQRSSSRFRLACELVRNGRIGKLQEAKVWLPAGLCAGPFVTSAVPAGLNWDFWLGPAPMTDYVKERCHRTFRFWYEYSGGTMTDWGAHMFDIVQWALDMDGSGPVKVDAPKTNGNEFLTYTYANGITMTHQPWEWNNGIEFVGTEGTLRVQRKKLETSKPALKDRVIGANEKHVYASDNHYKDFLNAIRNRSMPICDVEIGHRTASVCNIGNIAYALNKSLTWNPKSEKFNDAAANALLGRKMNAQWGIKL